MSNKPISRRELLKKTAVATAALALRPSLAMADSESRFDPKGLPTKVHGETGVRVPRIGLGTGSRFCAVEDEDKAQEILTYALDNGLYYWDTAHDYRSETVISEERLGRVLKDRRKEVFLATKVAAREPDQAKRDIEESLSLLQTDHLDLLQVHSLESPGDLYRIAEKGGVLDVVRRMRDQGVAKNIGFTGHSSAEAMARAAKEFDFDTMLISLNHHPELEGDAERDSIPAAAARGLGISVMKVIRPRETVSSLAPEELIRFALSLKHPTACVISADSVDVVKKNIALLKDFSPMSKGEMKRMRVALAPFYRHERVEWMQPSYRDGYWA